MISPFIFQCGKLVGCRNVGQCFRTIHLQKTLQTTGNIRKTIQKNEEVKKFRSYLLTKYTSFVYDYEKVIEKKFPTAMHLYRTFKVGMKEFYRDLIDYMRIIRILNTTTDGMKGLTLREIETYYKMRKEMVKVAPVLILSALPLTNYIIFPLAYFYPRQMLCSHFWSLQQRSEFQIYYLKNRILNHRPTFRCMQAELDCLEDGELKTEWGEILGCLGSGVQPSVEQILKCEKLFSGKPYSISNLKSSHVKYLLKMHNLHSLWFRRSRLREHAKLLRAMDRAVLREGGPEKLSIESLRKACFVRGLNPTNVRIDDMMQWLRQWLEVSAAVENETLSLLLHCPILLGYNQPSNWLLIY